MRGWIFTLTPIIGMFFQMELKEVLTTDKTGTHRSPWRLSEFDEVSSTISSPLDSIFNSLK